MSNGMEYTEMIQYWTGKLNDEVFNTKKPELEEVMYFHEKLTYFLGKQDELDNPIKQETFRANSLYVS